MESRAHWVWLGIGAIVGAIVVVATVFMTRPTPTQEPQATLGPKTFDAAQVRSAPTESIAAYAAALTFDSVLGAADERPFDLERNAFTTGVTSRIEPEIGSYRIAEADLADGRIIARLKSSVPAPGWGVGRGWTWWWVDKRGANGWRSVFIPELGKPEDRVVRDSLKLDYHYGQQWRQAIARFTHSTWGTCVNGKGCCGQT